MKSITLLSLIAVTLMIGSCTKAKNHCFRCIDLSQVDPAFDVCSNDTNPSGRNAYTTLTAGGHINSTNGTPDSCRGYDK